MEMSGKYLLDTNIVIALFANDPAVVGKIGRTDDVFVPAVVIGELFYGAKKSGRPEKNPERIERFVLNNVILDCDTETARLDCMEKSRTTSERNTILRT
jgi:tRNA(fMet)-specific endonuclease VapC